MMEIRSGPEIKFMDSLIGKYAGEAEDICADEGYSFRISGMDGSSFILTSDYNLKRVNVHIRDGIVSEAWRG